MSQERGQFFERIANVRTNLKWACENCRELLLHSTAVESLSIASVLSEAAQALARIESFDRAVMSDMVNANRVAPTSAVVPDKPVSLGF